MILMKYMFLRFPEGKTKALTLSYDDGCRQDIRFASAITAAGLKCTFNINAGYYGANDKDWHLTLDELREHIADAGHEIAVHGFIHRASGKQRAIEGIRDVLDCRIALERDFGGIIRGMAYPDSGIRKLMNGATYEGIKNYLRELDITYSRTLGGDNNDFLLPEDWYAWMPTAHHNNPKLFDWFNEFLNIDVDNAYVSNRYPHLFYIWGHSYEFDRENNWERLDKMCETFSGHKDIWYATNGQIREYVRAYESLVFSAKGNVIYNPTVTDVWFNADGTTYCIKSGETLKI